MINNTSSNEAHYEQGLHWLMGIPRLAHMLKFVLQVNHDDVAICEK
jgi:hypothetical protein